VCDLVKPIILCVENTDRVTIDVRNHFVDAVFFRTDVPMLVQNKYSNSTSSIAVVSLKIAEALLDPNSIFGPAKIGPIEFLLYYTS
jgi:hypothetical protein